MKSAVPVSGTSMQAVVHLCNNKAFSWRIVTIMGCSRDGLMHVSPPEGLELYLCLKRSAFYANWRPFSVWGEKSTMKKLERLSVNLLVNTIPTRSVVQWRLQKIDLPSLHKDLTVFDIHVWMPWRCLYLLAFFLWSTSN